MSAKYTIDELDLSSRRSVEIEQMDDRHAVVNYFFHDGKFWKAQIPLGAIQSIYGQAFNFSSVKRKKTNAGSEVIRDQRGTPIPRFGFINHVQSRFRLDPANPVKLFDLNDDVSQDSPKAETDDFVYSIEAVGPPGYLFDFRNGMSGVLMCAHRFLSMQEMVFERVVVLGYYVRESPPLPLSNEEKQAILTKSIQRSDQAGLNEPYYLYRCCATNNCTSNPFGIIDQCVKYTWLQRIGSWLYRLPLNPRLYLRVRGLDSDPHHFHVVRTEFAEFIELSDTKSRKRAVVREEIRKRREAKKKGH